MSQVTEHLTAQGLPYEVLHHDPTDTAHDEAVALGIDPHLVAKTVLLDVRTGHAFAVLPADCRLDLDMVRTALNSRHVHVASELELKRDYPEFEPGALPPLGALVHTPLIVDPSIIGQKEIVFAAGAKTESVRMRTEDLLRPAAYRVADICVPADEVIRV